MPECQNAIDWYAGITREWLLAGMPAEEKDPTGVADKFMSHLASHSSTKSRERHISASKCKEIGLCVRMIEGDQEIQDAVLSIHRAAMPTLSRRTRGYTAFPNFWRARRRIRTADIRARPGVPTRTPPGGHTAGECGEHIRRRYPVAGGFFRACFRRAPPFVRQAFCRTSTRVAPMG